jgi:hypothetical protein
MRGERSKTQEAKPSEGGDCLKKFERWIALERAHCGNDNGQGDGD